MFGPAMFFPPCCERDRSRLLPGRAPAPNDRLFPGPDIGGDAALGASLRDNVMLFVEED